MDVRKLMALAIPAGLLFAAYKFAPNALVRSAVIGVAGVAIAKQVPYLKTVV